MKFKSTAIPSKAEGKRFDGPKQVVPNQSMSLQDILERFTRGEALPVGMDVNYENVFGTDLEKVVHYDLVDRSEFIEKVKAIQDGFVQKEKAHKAKLQAEAKAKADKLAERKFKRAVQEAKRSSGGSA